MSLGSFDINGDLVRSPASLTAPITAPNIPLTRPTGAPDPNIPLPPDRADIERARQSGNDRKQSESVDPSELEVDEQLANLVQKGEVTLPTVAGDESMSNENQAFNKAVGTALSFFALANDVKNLIPKNNEEIPPEIFHLTESQHTLLKRKATEFASFGVVPYDVIEDFLYVLVTIDKFKDLEYIASVVGIPELINPSLVRNPNGILAIKDLYRIGYIANGLAALTKQFASEFQEAVNTADSSQSNFAPFNGGGGGGGGFSFGGIDNIINIGQQALTQAVDIKNLVSDFGSGGVPDLLQQIGKVPDVVQNILGNIENIQETFGKLASANIEALAPQFAELVDIANDAKFIDKLAKQLGPIGKLAESADLVGDVRSQLSGIKDKLDEVQQRFAETMQQISSAKPPGNIAELAEQFKGEIAFNMMKQVMGQVPPIQMLANNPMLKEPTGIGRKLFGQLVTSTGALDQTFNRAIAVFPSAVNAAATNGFSFQNFGSFGGGQSLGGVVSKVISGGVSSIIPNSPLSNLINSKTEDIANLLGSKIDSTIEMRRSDNAIPLMISMASALAGDTKCPFSTGVFSDAWKLASSVGNIVQDSNPQFLKNCQTNM